MLQEAISSASSGDPMLMLCSGTDHPFFPPLEGEGEEWLSVKTNYQAIANAFGEDKKTADEVLGGNAVRVLSLQ